MDSRRMIKLIANEIFSGCYRKCSSKSQIVRCVIYRGFSIISLYCWKERKKKVGREERRDVEREEKKEREGIGREL